jgi:fatty acid desaturase
MRMIAPKHKPHPVFFAAAIWNYLAAASAALIAFDARFARALALKGPPDSFAWELFAACVLVFGIGYQWAARDPYQHRDLVKLGTLGKPLVMVAAVWNFYRGAAPVAFLLGAVVDLLFGAYFLWFLMKTRKRERDVSELEAAPYLSIPKIVFDLVLWIGAGYLIHISSSWPVVVLLALFIGAVPLHDLFVQGHEGSHGLISRVRWVNELLGWFTLAPVFISGAAHRVFHLQHHLSPHREGDPEYEFFNRVVPGVPGWAFVVIPAAAPLAVNVYALRHSSGIMPRLRILAELAGALGLHVGLYRVLGAPLYLKAIVLPFVTGLPIVSFLRVICEHHATAMGNDWKTARSIRTNRMLEFFWSNVNYHLEHHLHPGVPYHKLPSLKRLLGPAYAENHANIGHGYIRTAATLVRERSHFRNTSEQQHETDLYRL